MTSLLDTRPHAPFETLPPVMPGQTRGRGSRSNASGRFEKAKRHLFDDGWDNLEEAVALKTEVFIEKVKTIITRNEFARHLL